MGEKSQIELLERDIIQKEKDIRCLNRRMTLLEESINDFNETKVDLILSINEDSKKGRTEEGDKKSVTQRAKELEEIDFRKMQWQLVDAISDVKRQVEKANSVHKLKNIMDECYQRLAVLIFENEWFKRERMKRCDLKIHNEKK
ncbi:uncharacterized protein [Halyomorpha halys]|uniref:uncharacterized protein n=1 Tax=Halyomorpha halys TaxID=286706 RepID=UPI0034D2C18E